MIRPRLIKRIIIKPTYVTLSMSRRSGGNLAWTATGVTAIIEQCTHGCAHNGAHGDGNRFSSPGQCLAVSLPRGGLGPDTSVCSGVYPTVAARPAAPQRPCGSARSPV